MPYAVNDKVRLTAARGGWVGYISARVGSPTGAAAYVVRSITGSRDEGTVVAIEADIEESLTPAAFEVGDIVSLGWRSGEIESDNGDGTFTVVVSRDINPNIKVATRHRAPLWLLGAHNE